MSEGWKPASALPPALSGLLMGNSPGKARWWIRFGWLAGFVWAAISFLGAVGATLAPIITEAPSDLHLGQFIFAIIEVGVITYLSYGVMRQRPTAAVLLFIYFVLSRIALVFIGLIGLGQPEDYIRLLIQGVFAFFFFQGLRGVLTFYHLTHPRYPASAPPRDTGRPNDPAQSGGE